MRRLVVLALVFCSGCACCGHCPDPGCACCCHCPDLIMDCFVGDLVRCACKVPQVFHRHPPDAPPGAPLPDGPALEVSPGADGTGPSPAAPGGDTPRDKPVKKEEKAREEK